MTVEIPLAKAICCTAWPVAAYLPVGYCGKCHERPRTVGPWDLPDVTAPATVEPTDHNKPEEA